MPFIKTAHPLDAGAPFPEFAWKTVNHGEIRVPAHAAGKWSVVLVYRGQW